MKGKAEISNAKLDANDVNPLAYNKVVEGLRKETSRRKSNSIGHESVDFETAISKAGCGKFNYFLILIAIPASCSSGFVTGAVSLVLPVAGCDLELSSIQKGLLNSAPYLGMVLSAFFWGFLSDAFGRQRLLTYGFLLDAMMSVCASLAPNLTLMLLFKFLSGIMVCGPYSIFMAYLSEVFMDTKRDVAVLSAGFFSAIGNIFQPILAMYIIPLEFDIPLFMGLRLKPWRLFLLVCSLPSLICGVSSYFCVESPKFLMDHGKQEEALTVFKKIYTINTGLPKSTYPVKHLHDPRRPSAIERGKNDENKTFLVLLKNGVQQALLLLKPPYVKRAFFFFFIQFGSMACLNVLRLWLPQMLSLVELQNKNPTSNLTDQGVCEIFVEKSQDEELNCKDIVMEPSVFLDMIWINAGTLFAHLVFIAIVKYVGKKLIITTTTLVAATSMLMIPLFASEYVVPFSSVVIAVLNITFFAVTGTVIMIFPTKIRATSVGLTMMFGRIGVLIANVGISSIMYTHCDLIFYILFAVLIVISVTSTFISTSPVEEESPNKKANNGNSSTTG